MASNLNAISNSEPKDTVPLEHSTTGGQDAVVRRRTKTGCLTCRRRRIKCGEEHPICKNCIKSRRECAGYNHPLIYRQHSQSQQQSLYGSDPSGRYGWSLNHRDPAHNPSNPATAERFLAVQFPTTADGYHSLRLGDQSASSNNATWNSVRSQAEGPASHVHDHQLSQWSIPPASVLAAAGLGSERYATSFEGSSMGAIVPSLDAAQPGPATYDTIQKSGPGQSGIRSTQYTNLGFIQGPALTSSFQPCIDTRSSDNPAPAFGEDEDNSDDPWDVDMDDARLATDVNRDQPMNHTVSDTYSIPSWSRRVASDSIRHQAVIPRQHGFVTSPLLEERSQRIFAHFMSVTGPCMGTFDRHDDLGINEVPRMIWTHGLPAMAFSCPALAHAILAVSAMHMSKLSLISENTAVKHFTCALRRVGSILRDMKRRHEVSTLATVLLLGYYEVMAGDHSRWNLHLSGGGKLVMEHNYAGMMRAVKRTRSMADPSISQPLLHEQAVFSKNRSRPASALPNLLDDNDWQVDQKLISKLMGRDVNYDTQIQPNFPNELTIPDFTESSLDHWRRLVELYWWYCRQDVFISLLSGDPLLLPYEQWKYCPPRGPLDNAANVHTTFDHLWLIVARLADFGGKDRIRKQGVVNAQGGNWIPAPGFLEHSLAPTSDTTASSTKEVSDMSNEAHRRPNANEGRARKSKAPQGTPTIQPAFYGMIPPASGPIQMPSSFNLMNAELRGNDDSVPTNPTLPQAQNVDVQTQQALEEHTSIVNAFDLFESLLGPDFQPVLSSDIQIATPFGPALQYKSPTIATMWTFFYVGRILLRRMHPHSPPAAMVSTGVNARVTHGHAQTIGRICGGLFAQHNYLLQAGHVNHILSSAVMETTFSLLFAAVQFQDPVQRGWTISKLSQVAQVTGWQTAAAVAAACEATWERAGLAGRGPPYRRTMDQKNTDARLNGKYSHAEYPLAKAEEMSPDQEHESRFVSHDRSLVGKHASTRAHWAFGLLSVEADLQRLSVGNSD